MRLGGLCIRELEEWWGARGEESEGRTQIHSDMEKREMKMKTEGGGKGRHTHAHTQAGRQARVQREEEDWQGGKCLLGRTDKRGMRGA